ncbi:unnamed protein product [Linum trigynum]|uniref:Uncharacterized protein n=1 Tax=Linum trigynum TaxID=586398 RepID=A0AAV2DVF5_9ROSI
MGQFKILKRGEEIQKDKGNSPVVGSASTATSSHYSIPSSRSRRTVVVAIANRALHLPVAPIPLFSSCSSQAQRPLFSGRRSAIFLILADFEALRDQNKNRVES